MMVREVPLSTSADMMVFFSFTGARIIRRSARSSASHIPSMAPLGHVAALALWIGDLPKSHFNKLLSPAPFNLGFEALLSTALPESNEYN